MSEIDQVGDNRRRSGTGQDSNGTDDTTNNAVDTTGGAGGDASRDAKDPSPLLLATDLADRNNAEFFKPAGNKLVFTDLPGVYFSLPGEKAVTQNTPTDAAPEVRQLRDAHASGIDSTDPQTSLKRDSQGRVIEITYPNGKSRQFGYDENGQLNRVVQPNGQVYELKNGKWQMESGKPGLGGQGGSDGSATQVGLPSQRVDGGTQPETGNKGAGDKGDKGAAHNGTGAQREPGENGGRSTDSPPGSTDNPPVSTDNPSSGGASLFGNELNFKNPKVEADGTFTFEQNDGSKTTIRPDGTRETVFKDGAVAQADANDRVLQIKYANGDKREFYYDNQGKLIGIEENRKKFLIVIDGEILEDGKPTGAKHPFVSPDGAYSVTDKNGNFTTTYPDRTQVLSKPDGSFLHKDANGNVTAIGYPNNTHRTFTYDDRGRLTSMTDPDGKKYEFNATFDLFGIRFGSFKAADGSTRNDVKVGPDGTVTYQDQDGKIHSDFTSGNSTQTTMTAAELRATAFSLHESNWFFTDNSTIKDTLDKMTPADRVALDEQYKEMYGQSLTEKLRGQMWNPLKRESIQAALDDLTEAHLRTTALKTFSKPEQLQRANKLIDDFRDRARQQGVPLDDMVRAQEAALKDLEKGTQGSEGKLKELERILGQTAPSFETLNTKYGVKFEAVTRPDGTNVKQYYVEGDKGQKLPILETSSDNPREVEAKLKEWRDTKIKELEQKHGIELSRDGQKDNPRGKEVDLRAPRINELVALEAGLNLSYPSTGQRQGKPILVQFAVQPTSTADAYVNARLDGQTRVLFEPMTRDFNGLRETILHEWAHVGERNMRDRNPAAVDKFFADMGYRKVQTEAGADQWQLRDKNGNYWTLGSGEDAYGTWTRVDEKGRPLKADGTLASDWKDPAAATRGTSEMRDNAAITPTTRYFPNPKEMGAEATRYFRNGEAGRSELYVNDPALYRAAKEFDQKELDADPRYGVNPDGSSKFIRLPDGNIVLNNEANRKIVSDYELTLEPLRKQQQQRTQQDQKQIEEILKKMKQEGLKPHQHQPGVCTGCN